MQPKLIICSGKLRLGTARARVVIRPECKHVVNVPGGRRILSVPEIYAEAFRRLMTYECHSYALENTYGGIICYLQKLPEERAARVHTSVTLDTAVH